MITYYFDGGLTNTCLQIFAMFLYCQQYNVPFNNIKIKSNYIRNLCYDGKVIKQYPIIENIEFFKKLDKYLDNTIELDYDQCIDIHDVKEPLDNVVFKGYDFPSTQTTEKNIDLFRELYYNCDLYNSIREKYKDILSDSLGIHIRRTDFTELYKDKILSSEHINSIIDSNSDKNVLIFSDDLDWCFNNIKKIKNVHFIKNDKVYEDLILMSMCKQCINNTSSSFSWFGFKYLSYFN